MDISISLPFIKTCTMFANICNEFLQILHASGNAYLFANCSAESLAIQDSAHDAIQSAQDDQTPFRKAMSATAEDIAAQLESIGLTPASGHDSLSTSYQDSGTANTISGMSAPDGCSEHGRQRLQLQPMQQPAERAWSLGPSASQAWGGGGASIGGPSHQDPFSDLGEFSSLDDFGQLKRRGPPR